MTDLQRHPILRAIYDVMRAIERCGASPELTEAVVLAGKLSEQAATILDERDVARAELARVREEREALLATVRRLVNLLHEAKAHLEKRPMSMCVMSPDRLRDSIASELAAIYARSASRSSGSGS